MRKYIISDTVKLYHVSRDSHDGEVFKPRVPDNRIEYEDDKVKRVCVSTSVIGALRGIACDDASGDYILHTPVNAGRKKISDYIYKPTVNELPDVIETREKWILCPVKMVECGCVKIRNGKIAEILRKNERTEN